MGKMNVAQFAGELGLPVGLLLEQLQAAGVAKKQETDPVSELDKSQLLEHLRSAHGSSKNKITLVRRETTAIKKADSTGKSRTIQVEVRKKRTLSSATADAPKEAPPVEAVIAPVAKAAVKVVDAQELSSRDAEARGHAELAERKEWDLTGADGTDK